MKKISLGEIFVKRQTGLMWLLFTAYVLQAQCPQRYLDQVFPLVSADLDNIYGGNRLGPDGTRTWLAFDVYQPKNDTAQLRPFVLLIHGGGFTNWPPLTRKTPDIVEMAHDLAKRGYVVISPEYRLYSADATGSEITENIMASAADIHDAMCFLVNSVSAGNPYRIDTSRFIIGGVSAGGMLALNFGVFVNDTAELPPGLRQAMNTVAILDNRDPQEVFTRKFCGVQPRGVISIGAGLFDSAFINYQPVDVLLIHGDADDIIPFGAGYYGCVEMYGSGFLFSRIAQTGMHVEMDAWPSLKHVPMFWNFFTDLPGAVVQTLATGSIFNQPVLDSTKRHMAAFCYNAIGRPVTDCRLTGILQQKFQGTLNIAPNPSPGNIKVHLPGNMNYSEIRAEVFDLGGRMIYTREFSGITTFNLDLSQQSPGMYYLKIRQDDKWYIDKLILQ